MEDQNNKSQTTPPTPPNPPSTPLAPTPLNAPPDQVVPPAQPILSASQMGWNQNDKPRSKKPLIIILITLILIIGTVAALYFTNVIGFSKFKTITYDNGKGLSFRLKFYSKYTVKGVAESTADAPGAQEGQISPNLNQLVSKVSVNGKTPLTLNITGGGSIAGKTNKGSLAMANNDCTQNGMDKAFDAHIDSVNADVAVCKIERSALSNNQPPITVINVATFHSGDKGYIALFMQDLDFSKMTSSPEDARSGLEKAGLDDYQDDITTILASVKPN